MGVAAFTAANPGVGLVLLDTPTAQTVLLGKPDVFTAITLDAQPGVDDAATARQAGIALGNGFAVSTKADQAASSAAQISSLLDVITYALLGFAAVAVLVEVFLILNTFSMLVAARTRELGLLRALGADRAQVVRSVLAEALLLGTLGSVVGLAGGIGLAALITTLIGQAGVDLSATSLVISPLTPLAAFAVGVGVGVTLAAAWFPARRAAQVTPMQALREAATPPNPSLRRRAIGGLALAAAGRPR